MRRSYGTTWWGQQWLNALNDIDFSNRLPRGRTYANKGAVSTISIDKNHISAQVQGSRRTPYRVEIAIPWFDAHTRARIVEAITGNPLFLSQLLNRQLPPELYEICLQQGIRIFPRTWKDIDGSCSCPDWAAPCKHLAAVLYLMANEIDKDPFLVFELHGFDLFKALDGVGYTAGANKKVQVLKASHLWAEYKEEQPPGPIQAPAYSEIDFTRIPDVGESLFRILGEQPVFFPAGDFKKELWQAYRSVSRSIGKELETYTAEGTERPGHAFYPEQVERVSIFLDEELVFLRAEVMAAGEQLLAAFNEEELFQWLWQLPVDKVEHLSSSLQQLFWAVRTAVALLERQPFVPQMLEVEEGGFIVRWLPAILNEQVRECLNLLGDRLEEGLLEFEIGGHYFPCVREEGVNRLISVVLNYFVHQYHGKDYYLEEDPVADLFFLGVSTTFDTFETREYPNAIQLWLNRFFIAEGAFVPALQFSDEGGLFEVRLAFEDKREALSPLVPLAKFFEEKRYASERVGLLRNLAMLTEFFPQLSRLIASEGKEKLCFGPEEFVEVLFEILPVIRLFGIKILLPKGMRKLLRPQLSLSLDGNPEGKVASSGIINIDTLLRFNWQVAIGGQQLSYEEFKKLARQLSGIVKLQDQYAYFDEKQVKALLDKLETPPSLSSQELLQAALSEDYDGAPIELSPAARKLLDDWLSGGPVARPEGLEATLRPYQERGFEWLYKNARIGFGSLIADDMGLGKTLQVIASLLKLKEEGFLGDQKAIAIVPTTLLTNWYKEIQKFAPSLSAHVYHGPSRSLEPLAEADLLITTYGVVRSEGTALARKKWLAVVIDEAQNIKNPATAQSKAVKKIKAPIRMAMTGTPVENRLSEYWSIFDFINKGYLGGLKSFKDNYARPIELERDQNQLERFRRITAPFILRRVKSDKSIITDLPDKIEKDQYCELTKEQAALYQNVVDNTMAAIEQADGINRRGLVLKLITALKQVCNHPRHFLKKGKADPILSGKATLLLNLAEQILDSGEKALIFTQYREMGDLLVNILKAEFGLDVPFLHGGVSRKGRDTMVENFQNNRATRIMLLSLKAGGAGLNLTAAANVIHYDLWWNPAVESQATDRAYRIGQQSNVMVHRFITQGTFEEKINTLLQNKKELAELAVASGEQWIGELGNEELRELVRLG